MNLLDKTHFANSLKTAFKSYTDNFGIFSTEDILVLVTKNIFDLMLENKRFSEANPFSSDKIRFFLRYAIKIHYYDSLINSKFDFVNSVFANEEIKMKTDISEINFKIQKFKSEFEKLCLKQKSAHLPDSPSRKDKNSFYDYLNNDSPYLKAIAKLDAKLLELIEQKNEIELEIIKIKQFSAEKIDKFKSEISYIENLNNEFKAKRTLVPFEIEQNKIVNNEEIIAIRNKIAEKFQRIKIIFNSTDHVSNQNNLLESCIDKIRQSVNDFRLSGDLNINDNSKGSILTASPYRNSNYMQNRLRNRQI